MKNLKKNVFKHFQYKKFSEIILFIIHLSLQYKIPRNKFNQKNLKRSIHAVKPRNREKILLNSEKEKI